MKFLDVLVEDDGDTYTSLAELIDTRDFLHDVKFLERVNIKYNDMPLYKFNQHIETIDAESVSGYYDDGISMSDIGYTYISIMDGFIRYDDQSDEDYSEGDE